ncbi:MAG TPA: hypothetical protein VF627_04010, partial [Abditibacterium sp.]
MKQNEPNDRPEAATGGSIGAEGMAETNGHSIGTAATGAPVKGGRMEAFNVSASLGLPHENYLNNDFSWKSWVYTLDHKRIGLMYLAT